jgi:aspartate kinase
MAERNQVFLKFSTKDYTFIVENHIRDMFEIFTQYHIFVNLLQNSGGYFFVSITHAPDREEALMRDLRAIFNVEVTHNLDLFTVRHPTKEAVEELKAGKKVVFEKILMDTHQVLLG